MLQKNSDAFLSELSKIFESGRQTGRSVWITMKRYDGRTKRNPRKPNDKPKKGSKSLSLQPTSSTIPTEYSCLIRAKVGSKKVSASIGQKEVNKFQQSYSNLIKGNIYGLKKRPLAHGLRGGVKVTGDQQQRQQDTKEKRKQGTDK